MSNKLECALCLEHFKDPRIIGCFHTFCYQCLQRYLSTHLNQQKYLCPVCRSENTLPKEGIAGLQKNFYVNEDTAKPTHPMCPSHPNEDLRFYCKTCNVAVCRDCKVISHTIHETDMLDNITNKIKQFTEKLLSNADKIIQDSWTEARAVLRTEQSMLNDVIAAINRKAEEMKAEVNQLVRVLTQRLNNHYTMNRQKCLQVDHICTVQKSIISTHRTTLSDVLSKANNNKSMEILEWYKNSSRSGDLKQLLRAPPAYAQLKDQTLSKDDVALYTQNMNKMFDNLKGNMRVLQGSVPELKRSGGPAASTVTPSFTQMKVVQAPPPSTGMQVVSPETSQKGDPSSMTPALSSRTPAVSAVAVPVHTLGVPVQAHRSLSTPQQQASTGSRVQGVSSQAVKRPGQQHSQGSAPSKKQK